MLKKIAILFVLVLSLFSCPMTFDNQVPGTSSDNAGFETEVTRSLSDVVLTLPFDAISGASRQIPLPWGTGTIGTGVSVAAAGIVNNCFSFDSTSLGYVDIPDGSPVNFGAGDFSLTCWVKTTKGSINTIIDKRIGGIGYHFVLYDGHMLLQITASNGWFNFWGGDSAPVFNDGKWHFLAVTVDRDKAEGIKMYADGTQIHTFNPTGYNGNITNTAHLYIGKHSESDSFNFSGLLDDVRIYKGLLSVTELASLPGITPIFPSQSRSDSWTAGLKSIHRSNSYARYFTFSLTKSTRIKINLSSTTVDTYLYLLSGRGVEGTQLAYDDDGGDGTNSQISTTLAAGNYTIEATTYYGSQTGAFTLALAQLDPLNTQHVVVIVMDGARYSETWGDPSHQYIPRITNEIAAWGVVCTNFWNSGYTETTAGHTALTTGVNQVINNNGTEFPANPGIFHYLAKQYSLPGSSSLVDTSKDKLYVLSRTTAPGWENYTPAINCGVNGDGTGGYRDDDTTIGIASNAFFQATQPRFMIVNLKDPDAMGHTGNWPEYLNAIVLTDRRIGNFWMAMCASGFMYNTTLFIVNDHGRHLDSNGGFTNHGDDCEGCRHVLCMATGPDFKTNYVCNTRYDLRDVTATAAYLLNVSMPTSEGRVMNDILK